MAGAPPRRVDAAELTAIVTRLRRILRTAVRSDYPWEILPMAQVEILQRLADEPRLRVRDLADRHRLAPNTISTLIQQMVTAGLVIREPDVTDRRAVTVSLTDAGERALAGWSTANAHRLDDALAELPDRDRQRIAAALPALTRLVAELERAERDRPGPGTGKGPGPGTDRDQEPDLDPGAGTRDRGPADLDRDRR